MTVLEIELAVLIVAVVAVAVVVAVTYSRTVALIGERQKAMDSYVKALGREKLTVTREAQKALMRPRRSVRRPAGRSAGGAALERPPGEEAHRWLITQRSTRARRGHAP
jgi:hypothetical protein